MQDNLTKKTINGLKWSYMSTIVTSIMQIVYTAIIARLLEPKAFGLVAMASVALRFGSYFAQMGLGQALIQKNELSQENIRASFSASIISGLVFYSLFWAFAPLLGIYLFNNSDVIDVIRLLALSFVITGISTTSLGLLRRKLNFRYLAFVDIFSYLIGYGLGGIFLALKGFGFYSLIIASLSQASIAALLSYLRIRHNIMLVFKWNAYKSLLSIGSRISIISFTEFLCSSFDSLFIGRFIGAIELGIYNRAFLLVNLPMQYFSTSISKVLLPTISRIQSEVEKIKKVYLLTISIVAFFLFPVCVAIAFNAEYLIIIILGKKWVEATPILQILALASPFNLLSHFAGIICEATATLNSKIKIQITYLIIIITLAYGLYSLGIYGVAIAVFISEIFRFICYKTVMKKLLDIDIKEYLINYLPGITTVLIITIVNFSVSYFMSLNVKSFILIVLINIFVLFLSLFIKTNKPLRVEVLDRLTLTINNVRLRNILYNLTR